MEEYVIIEINLILDDKQNAKAQQILQNGCRIFNVIHCMELMKMLIKVHQIYTVSANMRKIFPMIISRLYIQIQQKLQKLTTTQNGKFLKFW